MPAAASGPHRSPGARRPLRGLVLVAALLGPAVGIARPPVAAAPASYLDPPKTGLSHADRWVLEAAPVFIYTMRSAFNDDAVVRPGGAVDLRLARGLPLSGNELGARLRPVFLRGATGVMATGGYRIYFGREEWKTHLELELVLHWIEGPGVGLRAAGGVIRELGEQVGLILDAGFGGAVGQALTGWVEVRAALQLRF